MCFQAAEKSWQFDIFAFADLTPGHTLSMLFYHLVKQTGLLQALTLDQVKLCNFLRKVEHGYDPNNPYHNR